MVGWRSLLLYVTYDAIRKARSLVSVLVLRTLLVILPETAEVVWLGMFYECSSLKAVYIPKNVKKL